MRGSNLRDIARKRDVVAINSAKAASVTAGIPGSFTPVYPRADGIPYDFADLVEQGSLGETVAWSIGEYVVLQDGTQVYWDGAAWQTGTAP